MTAGAFPRSSVRHTGRHRKARPVVRPLLIFILAVGFGATGVAHAVAGFVAPWIELNAPGLARLSLTSSFFWIVSLG